LISYTYVAYKPVEVDQIYQSMMVPDSRSLTMQARAAISDHGYNLRTFSAQRTQI